MARAQTQRDDLGVPLYPGAERKALVSSVDQSKNQHLSEQYTTDDPVEKVAAFYRDDLGFKPSTKGSVTQLVGRTKAGSDVLIFVEPDGGTTKITIKGIRYPSPPK